MKTISVSLRPCQCAYQKQKDWGYNVLKWTGGKRSWRPLASAASLGDAAVLAARNQGGIVIRCNGCGAELVRETGGGP